MHPNAERVTAALASAGSTALVRELPDSARTAVEAAAALGVEVAQIAKSLVFLAGGSPVMVVASGADRVDTGKLSAQLGVGHESPEPTLRPSGRRPAIRSAA